MFVVTGNIYSIQKLAIVEQFMTEKNYKKLKVCKPTENFKQTKNNYYKNYLRIKQ